MIFVRHNCAGLASVLKDAGAQRVFVVCDVNVLEFTRMEVLPAVASVIGGEVKDVLLLPLRTSEHEKDMRTVQQICQWMMEHGADRGSFVLAVGGGITSDIAGFAGSIYMRGLRFAYVPTTLLSMVDAAIGGKTGVNFLGYKNILGSFCEPVFTYSATEVLAGLPERELLGGASELFKTFVIENRNGNYEAAVELFSRRYAASSASASGCASASASGRPSASEEEMGNFYNGLTPLIEAAAKVKEGIITRDFKEQGERRHLNLGHTFAHAIEHLSQSDRSGISHGEAVAMGMVLASRLSEKLGIAMAGVAERLEADLRSCGLRVDCPYSLDQMKEAMCKDKKADGGLVNFVLIRRIGEVMTQKMDPREL